MKKLSLLKTMLLLCALVAGSSSVWADADVSYDFTSGTITGSSNPQTVTVSGATFTGAGSGSFKFNTGYFMMGKNGAYITFPTYSNAVSKIVVTGNSGASGSTKMNIFVGETAVSTETTGSTGTNTYEIAADYQTAGTVYTLKVNSNHNAQITKIEVFYASGVTVDVTSVSLNKTATTIVEGETETLTATVAPADATNKSVTWTSSNTDVATVSSTGVVTAVSVGTATITVKTADGDFTATCNVNVTPAPPVAVTFDLATNIFSFPEGSGKKTTASYDYTYDGYTVNLSGGGSGNGYYWNTSGFLLMGKTGCTLTLPAFDFNVSKIKVYGTTGASESVGQNIFVGETAVSTATTGAKNVTNEYKIQEGYQAAGNVYALKVTSNQNTQISKIEIIGYLPVTITDAKYATFCSTVDADFGGTGVTVYKAKVEGKVAKFTEVTDGKVKAGHGVILFSETAKTYNIPVTTGATALTNNELIGVTDRTQVNWNVGTKYNYILQQSGSGIVFNKATGAYLPANRAYLSTTYDVTTAGARELVIEIDGQTTGIQSLDSAQPTMDNTIYDLAGRRVVKPTKGIYIMNGKKFVVK